MLGLVTRLCRRPLSRPTWRAGARFRDQARRHQATPKRWGQTDERYAYHYQYQHIKGERMLRWALNGGRL